MKFPLGDLLTSIYFQETDTRERIFNRLQLNFAIYASAIAIMAYMARTIDYSSACHAITLFYVGLSFSLIFIGLSIYHSILALTGFKYLCLPNSTELIDYENKVYVAAKDQDEYNKKYTTNLPPIDPEKTVRKFISKSLAKCIDHNRFLNEYRRKLTRRAILYIIISGGALLFSSVIFIAYDLDASSPRKSAPIEDRSVTKAINDLAQQKHNILIVQPITTQEHFMTDNKNEQNAPDTETSPPPPPPPPPALPPEPQLQFSMESITNSLPDRRQILNENEK